MRYLKYFFRMEDCAEAVLQEKCCSSSRAAPVLSKGYLRIRLSTRPSERRKNIQYLNHEEVSIKAVLTDNHFLAR